MKNRHIGNVKKSVPSILAYLKELDIRLNISAHYGLIQRVIYKVIN